MSTVTNFSPVSLSYVAALRGVTPRRPGEKFAYALMNCQVPEMLMGLAASNPEGQFFGFIGDNALGAQATEDARDRQVNNVRFICATPREAFLQLQKNPQFLPPLNYLCCDESERALTELDRAALYDFASQALQPGGLFTTRYRVLPDPEASLRFLVREFAPEMNAKQACGFLLEIKKFGHLYFKTNPSLAAKLDQAVARQMPDEFFDLFDQKQARSAAFDTIVAMRPRGFAYAGDTQITQNYVELAVPVEAQALIVQCRDNPLYETMKDFALNRSTRSDIWCRQPAVVSVDTAQLFGGFCYGIPLGRGKVPSSFQAEGKVIDLSSPLYQQIIALMSLMPVGIGDILAHPESKNNAVKDIVEAVQILIACGVAQPMRGIFTQASDKIDSIAQPRLVGSFNRYLDKTSLTGAQAWLASPVLGDVMTISARDALVMQALDRAGLANSVGALLPELQRLAKNPADAARIMDVTVPTEETAQGMIKDAISQSIVQWYAYGLLEAA